MSTDFVAKFGYMRSFGRVAFENGLQYRYSDSKIFHGNILATFYANMMKIGLVTPDITRVTNGPFWMRRQKRPISPNISSTTGTIFTNVSALVAVCMGITKFA